MILVSKAEYNDTLGKRLADSLDIKPKDLPAVRIVNFIKGKLRKYVLGDETNPNTTLNITTDSII